MLLGGGVLSRELPPAGSMGLGEWAGPGTCTQGCLWLERPLASHPIFSAGATGMEASRPHSTLPPIQNAAFCIRPIILAVSILSQHPFLSASSEVLARRKGSSPPPPPGFVQPSPVGPALYPGHWYPAGDGGVALLFHFNHGLQHLCFFI